MIWGVLLCVCHGCLLMAGRSWLHGCFAFSALCYDAFCCGVSCYDVLVVSYADVVSFVVLILGW